MIEAILKAIGIVAEPIPSPFKDRVKQTARKNAVPDSVSHVRGRAFEAVQTEPDSIEYDRWTNERTRIDTITDMDRQTIADMGLLEDKYAELKYLWSVYMPIGKAVKEMQTRGYKRGYGESTIEKYFGAMSKAHLSPTANQEGRG
jgi:hypothetical protein